MSNTTTMSARNKKFWAKSKPQQRIAVAKDVIKQLKKGFIKATEGDYLNIRGLRRNIEEPPQQLDAAFNVIQSKGGRCEVCGIGSCFVSLVAIGDKAKTANMIGDYISTIDSISERLMRESLREVFTPRSLTLIECAFERSSSMSDNTDSYKDISYDDYCTIRSSAANFGRKYKSAKGRLIAIMKNIIANKGTFKP